MIKSPRKKVAYVAGVEPQSADHQSTVHPITKTRLYTFDPFRLNTSFNIGKLRLPVCTLFFLFCYLGVKGVCVGGSFNQFNYHETAPGYTAIIGPHSGPLYKLQNI